MTGLSDVLNRGSFVLNGSFPRDFSTPALSSFLVVLDQRLERPQHVLEGVSGDLQTRQGGDGNDTGGAWVVAQQGSLAKIRSWPQAKDFFGFATVARIHQTFHGAGLNDEKFVPGFALGDDVLARFVFHFAQRVRQGHDVALFEGFEYFLKEGGEREREMD